MTETFNQLFPGFLTACAELHDALVPFAMAVLVLSFAAAFWNGPLNGPEITRFLTRIFLIVILITHGSIFINDGQTIVHNFVVQHVPARPENVAERYRQKLADAQKTSDREKKGYFSRLFSASFFESIIYAVLTLVAWAGMAVTFFVFLLQKIVLALCWVLTPVLFPFFAFPPLAGIAWRHFTRICGLLTWELGLALAACITDGILDGMVKDSFLKQFGITGSIGYGLNNVLALAVLAVWVIFSSIAAPLYMQRLVSHGASAASALIRAGDMTVNLGLPTLAALISPSWSRDQRVSSSTTKQPVPAMPVDTPQPSPTALASEFAREPNPNDPTGQLQVEAELESLNGLS